MFYIHFHPSLLNRTIFATEKFAPSNDIEQRFRLFYSVFQFDIQAVCNVEQIKHNLKFVLYSFCMQLQAVCVQFQAVCVP